MKFLVLFFFLFFAASAVASHIAGGGIELIHLQDNTYRINLVIYFDNINGNPDARDQNVRVSFFSKASDTFIFSRVLQVAYTEVVEYTAPECSQGELNTDRIVYTADVVLRPGVFNEPEGYYVAWERCCRNYVINNIYSQNPILGGGNIPAGQTFYLEFPSVIKEGLPFRNSSPRLLRFPNDYACPSTPYYVDLSVVDDDGDDITYSLVTPYSTHTAEPFPAIRPQPYPSVIWRPGYNLNNMIRGSPDLSITSKGILTAVPSSEGLFVFAIQIDEFRDGKLIGSSRFDYQLLVVDHCDLSTNPVITGPAQVTINPTNTGADRCVTVTVSDLDSQSAHHNFTEEISIRAIGLDFDNKYLTEILPEDVTATLTRGSTQNFLICFPVCSPAGKSPYQVGIIVMDDACSLPLLDTLKITVNADVSNTDPYFTVPNPVSNPNLITVNEGTKLTLPFEIRDDDRSTSGRPDVLDVFVASDEGIVLSDAGIDVLWRTQPDQSIVGELTWDAACRKYDFSHRTSFPVTIRVEDRDLCKTTSDVELVYTLNVTLPPDEPPIIDSDLTVSTNERFVYGIREKVYDQLSFVVTAEDKGSSNNFIVLDFLGSNALQAKNTNELAEKGGFFSKIEGNQLVQSQFTLDIGCELFDPNKKTNTIDFSFIAVDDQNYCGIYMADTLAIEIEILPPDNNAPHMQITNMNTNTLLAPDEIIDLKVGEKITLHIQGDDPDAGDLLQVDVVSSDENAPTGYLFSPQEAIDKISTQFIWEPNCSSFQQGNQDSNYALTFQLYNDRCSTIKTDEQKVQFNITDGESRHEQFQPTNFFSPNQDGKNDYYAMTRKNSDTGLVENILPIDNCSSTFLKVYIYNRWGQQIFSSSQRDFKWYAPNHLSGVYYYLVEYSDRIYKGPISIRY